MYISATFVISRICTGLVEVTCFLKGSIDPVLGRHRLHGLFGSSYSISGTPVALSDDLSTYCKHCYGIQFSQEPKWVTACARWPPSLAQWLKQPPPPFLIVFHFSLLALQWWCGLVLFFHSVFTAILFYSHICPWSAFYTHD